MDNISIGNKIWLEKNGQFFLGKGRVELLKSIVICGSISAAAKSMKMSYKKAWTAVDDVNSVSDEPLVIRTAGGSGGGGTLITEAGKEAIELYERFESNSRKFLDNELKIAQQ
jgi:molybdate transport system regulatory protein